MPTQPPHEPYGNTPLTTESLATLGHPLSASDFNQDAQGRYWRIIRGQKTYYAPEWFDQSGTYAGTETDAAKAKTGTGASFFKQGQTYNWNSGEWENPTNWANVIGTLAAGGVGAGIAAPFVAGAVGGAAGGGTSGGLGLTSGLGANATVGSVLGNPLVQGGIKTGIDAARGNLSWKDALNFVPAIPGANNIGGAITSNPIAKGAINAGVQSGLHSAATGQFDPRTTAFDIAGGAVPGVAASVTDNPIARRGLTAGLNVGLNTARTGQFNPTQAAVAGGRVLMPTTSGATPTGTGMPTITRKLVDDGGGLGWLTPTGFTGFEDGSAGADAGAGGDPTDPNDPAYTGGWPSNDNVGPGADDGGVAPVPSTPTPGLGLPLPSGGTPSGDVPGQLPSRPTPGQGLPLPSGGTPSGGVVPAPPGTGSDPAAGTGGFLNDLTKILSSPVGGLLGGFLSGLGQSLATQKRQSFAGTAADPVAVMGTLGTGLKGLIGGFQDRVNQGVSLPDAYIDLRTPVFTGGGTALPVGIVPKGDASIGRPATLTPTAGIVPRQAAAPDAGLSTQAPDVNLPGSTPGQQYALTDPKQRALAALSLLGVS